MADEPCTEPFAAIATDGVVIIDGAGVAITLAASAATSTGESLLAAGAAAKQQRDDEEA